MSVYIIPKEQLDSCIITVNVLGHKITGFEIIEIYLNLIHKS